jgi:hypothetical protein
MKLWTYASGYPRLYRSDEEEISVLENEEARRRRGGIGTGDPENPHEHWWPSSLDFKEEAVRTGLQLRCPAMPCYLQRSDAGMT